MPSGWLKGQEQSPHLVPHKYPSLFPHGKEKRLILRITISLKWLTCIFNLSTESTLNGEAIFTKVSGGFFLPMTANSVITP